MSVSRQHALMAKLFKDNLPTLLRWAGLEELAPHAHRAMIVDPTFEEIMPVESRTDVFMLHMDDPPFFVIGEIQTSINPKKAEDWPWYWIQANRRERCDGVLLIVPLRSSIIRWAQEIAGAWKSSPLRIEVLQPDLVPEHWTETAVQENLSAALMGLLLRSESLVDGALPDLILQELKKRRRTGVFDQSAFDDYIQLLMDSAPPSWRSQALEYNMALESWTQQQRDESRAIGLQEGLEQGLGEGLEAFRRAISTLAARRDLHLTPSSIARLNACRDLDQLLQWHSWLLEQSDAIVELP